MNSDSKSLKRFDRTAALIGQDNLQKLMRSSVIVVGLGGVGGACLESLARSGIGHLTVVDGDEFEYSNLNRQILCTEADIGRNKAEVAKARVLAVNGSADVTAIADYVTKENVSEILSGGYSYCVDAIDDISGKTALIAACNAAGIPIVSAMGAGNRLDCDFETTDLFKTKNDPFARAMRRALKGVIDSLDVVCATSPPTVRSGAPASIAPPPIVMGTMLACHVIKRLAEL